MLWCSRPLFSVWDNTSHRIPGALFVWGVWVWVVVVCSVGCVGGCCGGVTPGPFSNPEAKFTCADGTALGRVWESRSLPACKITEYGVGPVSSFGGWCRVFVVCGVQGRVLLDPFFWLWGCGRRLPLWWGGRCSFSMESLIRDEEEWSHHWRLQVQPTCCGC